MDTSPTIGSIAKAMVAVNKALPSIAKSGNNPAFRSRYMTLDTILDTIRPILAANDIVIVQSTRDIVDDAYRPISVAVESRIIHASGEWMSTETTIPLTKVDAHGMGSAISYGRRYSLCALLAISADDDDDGNNAVAMASPQARVAPRPSQPQPQPLRRIDNNNGNR